MPSTKSNLQQTPRTDALVHELQSTPIPFEIAFWRLMELARTLERENFRLKKKQREMNQRTG